MDYLYKKADGSATRLGKTVTRLQFPEQTGGDMVFPGDQRPVDLGDYVLVKAIEVTESLSDSTKRGPTTVAIDTDAVTVTVTETAVDKDADDLANDVSAARGDLLGQCQFYNNLERQDCSRQKSKPEGLGI